MTSAPASIFIVDDDPDVRGSLQCLLVSETRRVSTYASADAFLTNFELVHPCCLILDLRLPGMSGQELLEDLHARQISIPVIIISAHADVPTALRALRLGAVDVCQKPVDPQELLPLVARTLAEDAARARQLQQLTMARQRLASLTPRERELFNLVVEGKSYKEMASTLGISTRTVEHHRAHISTKLGMDRVADLVRLDLFASAQGLMARGPLGGIPYAEAVSVSR